MMRMIIDTDAGADDAQAIMLALAHPGVQVEAITTVCGNVGVEQVTANVFLTLDVLGRDVPVYKGAALPLVADLPPGGYFGVDGMGGYPNRPATARRAEDEPAALALIRLANANPGELMLVALAPLTNIALATRLDPSFPGKIKDFVFMGGATTGHGNTANIAAEWNVYCDPEAACIVLNAFPKARMVSWETTLDHPIPWAKCDDLVALGTPAAQFFRDTSYFGAAEYANFLLPDPLAMAVALEPGIVKRSVQRHVTVELHGTHTRGQTVIDHGGRLKRAANVEIVTELDTDAVYELFRRAITSF
jgi:purine nucleosidase